MATGRTLTRIGVVLATVGLALGSGIPMASAHGFGHGHGHGHDGGEHGGGPSVPPPAGHYSSCGEDGLYPLNPLVSGAVHNGVEPLLGYVEDGITVTGGNLEEAVHAIDCSTVVPLENALNYGTPYPHQLILGYLATYYEYVREVCVQEGVPYTCLGVILP